MPSFKYEVQDAAGQISSGVVQAGSAAEVTQLIRNRGGYLLNVAQVSGPVNFLERVRKFKVQRGPGLKDVFGFTSQLSVMIKAGINVRAAVGGIAEQVENDRFRRIIERIKDDLESGEPFSAALAKHPKVFSPLYVNMVKASELSGNFAHMLERIAKYLNQQIETRRMVIGAMVYPAIIGIMAVGTTIFLLAWVLPRFTTLFEGKEALLPMPTLALIAISNFMRSYWYLIVLGVGGAITAFCLLVRTPSGRWTWDKFKLRVPLFRKMLRALYITRGMHTMGELINAGVPMLDTLKITADVSGNLPYRQMWEKVRSAVKEGGKIAHPLGNQTLLPANVVQMISAGEESGNLGEVMRDVSEYYASELRNTIKSTTAMIEPLMIIVMGLVVGFIAMSIILPIFKMSQLVK